MTEDSVDVVEQPYAQVAADVLESLDDDAPVGRESCCEPVQTKSQISLYAKEVAESLPEGACAASRGCGDPVSKADLQPGEKVCDLGSGGGIDALIAGRIVGEAGHVYGIDMTDEMLQLARRNARDAGAENVEFIAGNIEDIPLPDAAVDVVISNCVVNLCKNKFAVLADAGRIIRPGGRFVISDIVMRHPADPSLTDGDIETLCKLLGCLRGVLEVGDYTDMLHKAGFVDVAIEPKTVYSFEHMTGKMRGPDDERIPLLEEVKKHPALDGLLCSAIVRGLKA